MNYSNIYLWYEVLGIIQKIMRTRTIPEMDSGGVCGTISTVNLKLWIAQKLCRVILFDSGLVTFRFRSGRTRKPVIFMIFGFLNVPMTPETNYISRWRHKMASKNQRKSQMFLERYYVGNLKFLNIEQIENVGKDEHRVIPEISLIISLKILNMRSTFIKSHEMEFW